ncbi:MAG: polyphosphate kinase 1 [Gammaproteobacteria bacterium]|nr:polyphosphate kinase 1 [Gammaproteobacteria bacterium]MYK29265.1 polyphosphate kinase 1 [Gammaproteobacteria bacterium]
MDAEALANPDLYINRELSLLEFHLRVLAQARDETLPLLERLRFLCISSSILDEFFEIRVAGLKQQAAYGVVQRGADNLSPAEQLRRIAPKARDLIDEQYRVLNDVLLPALDQEGIHFINKADWSAAQSKWIKRYFNHELAPIMSPIGLDPAHPFPDPLNKSLAFIVNLKGKDAFGRNSGKAIVQAPRALPRVVRLPESCADGPNDFVLLSSIIDAHMDELFPGMQATGVYQFRVTRNSDLFVDEEEVDDLLRALEGELPSRRYGEAVRLEVAQDCPEELEAFLTAQFQLSREDVYRCNGPVNLMRLATVPDLVERPDLKYPGFRPGVPGRVRRANDMFEAIAAGDVLLHHPFESFAPFLEFLRQAARDPGVLSIRQTLYRTGAQSAVVEALTEAASNGKEVMVVIELRARFDEAANIELANHLQSAGAQVVYGVVGHKTHAKMCMVIRREGRALKRYVHLGTGNYHTSTARLYTDYGLFTCDPAMGNDVQKVFAQLTAMGKAGRLKKLLQSPFTLHKSMLEYIDAEAENARNNRPARVAAKMNSLIDRSIIQALYRASQAGVKVDLIIRGICALRPGVPGVSENIRVRSIIGRFLEHTRVFYFENGGESKVYLSSADWMGRNFFNRVEVCFPVENEDLKKRVVLESIDNYLQDNCQAWQLGEDGAYRAASGPPAKRKSAQQSLLTELSDQ